MSNSFFSSFSFVCHPLENVYREKCFISVKRTFPLELLQKQIIGVSFSSEMKKNISLSFKRFLLFFSFLFISSRIFFQFLFSLSFTQSTHTHRFIFSDKHLRKLSKNVIVDHSLTSWPRQLNMKFTDKFELKAIP